MQCLVAFIKALVNFELVIKTVRGEPWESETPVLAGMLMLPNEQGKKIPQVCLILQI